MIKDFLKQNSYLKKSLYQKAFSRAFYTNTGIALHEIKYSFPQFFTFHYPLRSLLRVLKFIILAKFRLFAGRSMRQTYGFTGEDRIIEGILKPLITAKGFYVEVGCNHPELFSNSFLFYRRGWRGICIDANPSLIKKFKLLRPKDIAVAALISNRSQEREFFILTNDVLSTTVPENLEGYSQEGQKIEQRLLLKTKSLTEVLEENNCPIDFDFLSIDAEEHDLEVLKSLDLNKYKPQLIIVEDERFDLYNSDSNSFVNYLRPFGYKIEGYILKNIYFKKI